MECLNCKGNDLSYYEEKRIAIIRTITKANTISKRIDRKYDATLSEPYHLECDKCNTRYDFSTDDKGKIIDIWEQKA